MALILNIDTSGNKGVAAFAKDGDVIKAAWNDEPMQHAAFVQPAVERLVQETGISLSDIDAIAVSNGPGSYTGLRVGLASAKGLCYALDKPLIAISSLKVMASSVLVDGTGALPGTALDYEKSLPVLYCPMIDARRMEVFFALYDEDMREILSSRASIVDEHFLQDYLGTYRLIAVGTGSDKWKNLQSSSRIAFVPEPPLDKALCKLSYDYYAVSKFDSLVDTEPFYAKEFHSTNPLHHRK